MSPVFALSVLLTAAYLVGAIPFGYLIGRSRGVNLFAAGSGNIGATNAARVLGVRFGILVFVLDLLKGAIPCAVIVPLLHDLSPEVDVSSQWLRVGAAALAFLGHLFPVYLGFRGGKGVATGLGTILVLVPGPALIALLVWTATLLSSRTVSLASLAAAAGLLAADLLAAPAPFAGESLPVTLYLIVATALVVVKHRGNLARLARGTESAFGEFAMRQTLLRGLHVLALGFWFGGAGFFNFVAAPAIFTSFKQVVYAGPSDRTAQMPIIPSKASDQDKNALASALAGAAVGPIFERYFAMQAICGIVALITALNWRKCEGKVHRVRIVVIALAVLTVAVGWPLSVHVSDLRRISAETGVAPGTNADFVAWHLVSLFLSFVTVCLAGVALALAAKLPETAFRPANNPLS